MQPGPRAKALTVGAGRGNSIYLFLVVVALKIYLFIHSLDKYLLRAYSVHAIFQALGIQQ